jgi:N-acetyl-anhydromuramyl-L-alanine amidase AmpD
MRAQFPPAEQTVRTFGSRGFGTHFVVGQDGVITQTASLNNWTQHVGKPSASNPGMRSSNTVGIEVVGNYNVETEESEALTEEQTAAVVTLVNTLYDLYGLTYENVYNHEDLSAKTKGEGEIVKEATETCINNCTDEN